MFRFAADGLWTTKKLTSSIAELANLRYDKFLKITFQKYHE